MSSRLLLTSPSLSQLAAPSSSLRSSGFQLSKIKCRVHPSVIVTMLDAHTRLFEANGFAIGTLLGTVTTDGGSKGASGNGGVVVEIVDCFANPFQWDRANLSLTIQKDSHEWMLKLREKINPKLSVVGWCCTAKEILYTHVVSDWAKQEQKISRFVASGALPDPVHIIIDPSFENEVSILSEMKAYIRGPLKQLFHEVPLDLSLSPADMPGTAGVIKSSKLHGSPVTANDSVFDGSNTSLTSALRNLLTSINRTLEYIQAVLSGNIKGDIAIGRELLRAVCLQTLLPKEEVAHMLEGSIEDNLMVAYLVNLARLQFAAAEKLNTSFN